MAPVLHRSDPESGNRLHRPWPISDEIVSTIARCMRNMIDENADFSLNREHLADVHALPIVLIPLVTAVGSVHPH